MKAKLKVSRAVTKAAFDHPFFGSLAMSLKVEQDDSIPTACTDGTFIKWNESFIDQQNEDQTLGLLCHEIMHVILQHCQVWPGKDAYLCNVAMDYVINNTLEDEGFKLPDGGITDPQRQFKGMTWQQVYAILADIKEKNEQAKDKGNKASDQKGNGSDAANKADVPADLQDKIAEMLDQPQDINDVIQNGNLSDAEKEELKSKIEEMTIRAAEAQKNSGRGRIPGGMEELIKEIRTAKVDWKERIRTAIISSHPDDYSMRRPNRKMIGYDVYMPTMEGTRVGTLVIGLDTSGSVSKKDLVTFLSEMNAISQELLPEKVIVMYTDCDVARVEEYECGEEITELNARGGGGTSFRPVFEWIEEKQIEVDNLIYFSDMEVWEDCFPKEEPDYPVLWLSTRADYNVPFGELVRVTNN